MSRLRPICLSISASSCGSIPSASITAVASENPVQLTRDHRRIRT
jgi:hypothetical protein